MQEAMEENWHKVCRNVVDREAVGKDGELVEKI
jgi:hypothetical protein